MPQIITLHKSSAASRGNCARLANHLYLDNALQLPAVANPEEFRREHLEIWFFGGPIPVSVVGDEVPSALFQQLPSCMKNQWSPGSLGLQKVLDGDLIEKLGLNELPWRCR